MDGAGRAGGRAHGSLVVDSVRGARGAARGGCLTCRVPRA